MALQNRYHWEFPLNSEEFIRVLNSVMASGVFRGFSVVASSLPLQLNVTPGVAICHGAVIENDGLMVNVAGIPPGTTAIRKDIVVLEYLHGGDPNTNVPRIKVIVGDAGEPAPVPGSNQILLATIAVPPSAAVIDNTMIAQAKRMTFPTPGSLEFARNVLVGTEFSDVADTVDLTDDGRALTTSLNLKVEHAKVPANLLLASARQALEGRYPGNFEITHTYNAYGRIGSSVLTIKDLTPNVVIPITYTYDANQRLATEVLNITSHQFTVTYEYPAAALGPSKVTQVVTNV